MYTHTNDTKISVLPENNPSNDSGGWIKETVTVVEEYSNGQLTKRTETTVREKDNSAKTPVYPQPTPWWNPNVISGVMNVVAPEGINSDDIEAQIKSVLKNLAAKKVGEFVKAGDVIGRVGSGNSTGPHLRYEVPKADKPNNPDAYTSW